MTNQIFILTVFQCLSFTKQMNFCCTGLTTMAFQAKLLSHCFSKSYSMVMKLSKMLLQFCTVWFVLRWILLQLQTKGCCEKKGVVISSCFPKLVSFIVKRFYNLLYNPTCGLLCLLSYWKSINSHSYTYNASLNRRSFKTKLINLFSFL